MELSNGQSWKPDNDMWYPGSPRQFDNVGLVLRVEEVCQSGSKFAYHVTKKRSTHTRLSCSKSKGFIDRPSTERRIALCQIICKYIFIHSRASIY